MRRQHITAALDQTIVATALPMIKVTNVQLWVPGNTFRLTQVREMASI